MIDKTNKQIKIVKKKNETTLYRKKTNKTRVKKNDENLEKCNEQYFSRSIMNDKPNENVQMLIEYRIDYFINIIRPTGCLINNFSSMQCNHKLKILYSKAN